MFRKMAKSHKQISQEECVEILANQPRGVLSVLGDDDYPYGLPINHFYCPEDGKLYFHSGRNGHKADAVRKHDKASFCVVAQDDVVPSRFTTRYRSVIAFGRVREVQDAAEKRESMIALARRYGMGHMERGNAEIEESWDHLLMIALDIEHMPGKESLELTESRV